MLQLLRIPTGRCACPPGSNLLRQERAVRVLQVATSTRPRAASRREGAAQHADDNPVATDCCPGGYCNYKHRYNGQYYYYCG
jgi:hypothetical protein